MTHQAGQKEFLPWADLIRLTATVLVITVHVSGQLTNAWGKIPESDWFIANIYGGIARICVPLFFMISGYLLLPYSEPLGTFYKKRLPKVVIPLIAWSLIYLGWYCGNHPGVCTPHLIQNLLLVRGAYLPFMVFVRPDRDLPDPARAALDDRAAYRAEKFCGI